jgi:hypothetical protein
MKGAVRMRASRLLLAIATAPRVADMSLTSARARHVPVLPITHPPAEDGHPVGEWTPWSLRSYKITSSWIGYNVYRRGLVMLEHPSTWRLTYKQAERSGEAWVAGGEW